MPVRRPRRLREFDVTALDIEFLYALEASGNVVEACARIGITRDTGMYRLRRLRGALGLPAAVSERGGSGRGSTVLTEAGRRILVQGAGPVRLPRDAGRGKALGLNVLRGTWRSEPQPHVRLSEDIDVFVSFVAREGAVVRIAVEPEAILVARSRFRSSARNVIRGTVESVRRVDALRSILHVRVARNLGLDAAVTPRSERELGLRAGVPVYLYLKATAVSRLP